MIVRTIQEHIRISVVIPAVDAAAELPEAILQMAGIDLVEEVVVVDGESRDDTVALAIKAGARVVSAPRGRGSQLARGADAATGEWLLFLHADCRLETGWEDAVHAFVGAPDAGDRAGYFALALDDDAPAARRLERLVAWRCRMLALPYGDQGLLISRTLYDEIDGYKAIPLMEDVDIARRLGRARLRPIGATITASAVRYRRDGYWWRSLRNLFCLSLYFLGVPLPRIAKLYG
jgi:rSAM/selenodomain-associated transferase 2